ncbi:MAG: hypothetical protein ACJ789_04230 [Thermomicrobiales bacterium]
MNFHVSYRLLLVAIAIALLTGAFGAVPVAAKGDRVWTDTMSRENVHVQTCSGFDITSSYTTDRTYRVVEDDAGRTVFERASVSFVGSVVNATSGKRFGFDGGFVRVADYERTTITISDLILRIDPPGQGEVTVAVAHQERDLIDNPPAVLLAFAPYVLRNGLCDLLGDPTLAADPFIARQTIPDPCLILPRGKPC